METGFSMSVNGVAQAFEDHAARAERISRAAEHKDLAKDMVGQIQDEKTVKANLETIKTRDEMMGTLLDILA